MCRCLRKGMITQWSHPADDWILDIYLVMLVCLNALNVLLIQDMRHICTKESFPSIMFSPPLFSLSLRHMCTHKEIDAEQVSNRKTFAGAESISDVRTLASVHLCQRTDEFVRHPGTRHLCREKLLKPKESVETKVNVVRNSFLSHPQHVQKNLQPHFQYQPFSVPRRETPQGQRTQAPREDAVILFLSLGCQIWQIKMQDTLLSLNFR